MELPQEYQHKGFWDRPEGTAGMIVTAAIVIGGAIAVYALQGFLAGLFFGLISLIGSALAAIVLVAVVAAVVTIVTNPRFSTLWSYYFKALMRRITNPFISVYWEDILKDHLKNSRVKREIMVSQTSELNGQMTVMSEQIRKNERAIQKLYAEATASQQLGKQLAMQAALQEAQAKTESNAGYTEALARMNAMKAVFEKYIEYIDYLIRKLDFDITENIEKKKLMDKAKKVLSAAKSIMKSGDDEALLYDETVEWMAQDYGNQLGQIEEFMTQTKPLIERFDVQNLAQMQEGLAALEAWQLKNGQPRIAQQSSKQTVPVQAAPVQQKAPVFLKKS